MKSLNKKKSLFLFLLLLFFLVLFFVFSKKTQAGYDENVAGWIWSENIGWFEMNNVETASDGIDYGLHIDLDNNITGWIWSEHTGWVCFGTSCSGTPPSGSLSAVVGSDNNVSGWARVKNLQDYGSDVFGQDDWGWVALSGTALDGSSFGVSLNPETRQLEGWAWSYGGTDNTGTFIPSAGYGWISFNYVNVNAATVSGNVTDQNREAVQDALVFTDARGYSSRTSEDGSYTLNNVIYSDYRFTATKENCRLDQVWSGATSYTIRDNFTEPISIGGREFSLNFVLYCEEAPPPVTTYTASGTVFEDLDENGRLSAGDNLIAGAIVYTNVGVSAFTNSKGQYIIPHVPRGLVSFYASATDFSTGSYPGNPINMTGDRSDINISVERAPEYEASANLPWLQTMRGDVHANLGITAKVAPPEGYVNATYLISSGGELERFYSWEEKYRSTQEQQDWTLEIYRDFGWLPPEVFGEIDTERLLSEAEELSDINNFYTEDSGKYKYLTSAILSGGSFNSASSAKTLIVDGDLTISGNMAYPEGVFNQNSLPSVGIIVMGDLYISGNVSRIIGAYYVTGTIRTVLASESESNIRLINEGLMVAGSFEFKRNITHDPDDGQYRDITIGSVTVNNEYTRPELAGQQPLHFDHTEFESPSELIFYDGRVAVNTPPGFEDFASQLPGIWEEVVPQ